MDCRGDELIQHNNRASAQAVPFQYLINEQAKSILALQELQNEVGALLEFRDLVMDTFPHLRHKPGGLSSPEPSSGSQGVGSGESRWEPGVRVRRKLGSSSGDRGWIAGGGLSSGAASTVAATSAGPRSRSNSHGGGVGSGGGCKGPKSGEPVTTSSSVGTVQDSGFCAESSKDSSSSGSRGGGSKKGDDELWSLLEVIQDKGVKLKREAEFLRTRLLDDDERLQRRRRVGRVAGKRARRSRRCRSLEDLLQLDESPDRVAAAAASAECSVFRARVDDLKRERDALLDRVVEMEAESLSSAAQVHRLLAELRSVVSENKELEERLCGGGGGKSLAASSALTPRKSSHTGGFAPVQPESTGPSSSTPGGRDAYYTPSQHSACNLSSIELRCKQCSSYETDDGGSRQQHLVDMVRPSDPISRNLEGRVPSPSPPLPLDIGSPTFAKRLGVLDGIVSSPVERIGGKPVPGCGPVPGTPLPRRTLAAILKTFNPIELQRHLITISYENTNLVRQVDLLNKSKMDVSNELNRSKEDNEELKFQLEEKRIELEGTMARVRLLQLHQEQQQHGPSLQTAATGTATTTTTNQWLDLVPSNPILPQIALPATPASSAVPHGHHVHHNNHHHHHHNQDDNVGGGSSSTESAHQARSSTGSSSRHHSQPSKIPVVKSSYSAPKPPSSYRGDHQHTPRDPYPSWNKCKSDQSLPRNWDPISRSNGGGGGSSIGSGGKPQRGGKQQQDSLQQDKQHHHRARRDSSTSGGGASLTRARSQNHHQRTAAASANSGKDGGRTAVATATATTASAASSQATDDTNKPKKQLLFRRRNLVRQKSRLMMDPKTVLPALDEVQEPPDDSVAAEARRLRNGDRPNDAQLQQHQQQLDHNDDDDDDDDTVEDDELFFDSIESSLATSAASSRRPPPECDSIDLSQPDYSPVSSLAT